MMHIDDREWDNGLLFLLSLITAVVFDLFFPMYSLLISLYIPLSTKKVNI